MREACSRYSKSPKGLICIDRSSVSCLILKRHNGHSRRERRHFHWCVFYFIYYFFFYLNNTSIGNLGALSSLDVRHIDLLLIGKFDQGLVRGETGIATPLQQITKVRNCIHIYAAKQLIFQVVLN